VTGSDCLACHKNNYDDRAPPYRKASAPASTSEPPLGSGPSADEAQQASPTLPQDTTTFLHSRHQSVKCVDCHGTTGTHGELKIHAPDGCRGCHHDAKQPAACAKCHNAGSIAPKAMSVVFRISARPAPATRSLVFRHEQHAKLVCARCHASNAARTVSVTCSTCHADHHSAERDCAACHPDARTSHERSAHDGCERCHGNAGLPAITASRTLCLACHTQQRDHHPGEGCASCHAVLTPPLHAEARRE
jgi:hypothetical protein